MTPNMSATLASLRSQGFMCAADCSCRKVPTMKEYTVEEKTEISRAFSAGSYANAYETTDLETALDRFERYCDADDCEACDEGVKHEHERGEHERAAFVLGFFSTCSLDEIGSDREIFDECYFSDAGRYVVTVAKYCDDRADEYAEEKEIEDGTYAELMASRPLPPEGE